ncbi:MAG: helix-turn-helix domain-containing protein [Desulfobacteraceae bacterium]|nr:MAG: helix-turn-helix domain-containing protein [Desulfobacteraceae bacterium]
MDIILLLCNKQSVSNIVDLFGINATTIQRWVGRLNKFGFEGLRDKPGRGRRSLLSEADQTKLKKNIENRPKILIMTRRVGTENFCRTISKRTTILR